ncbi:uncharacterized protein LOC144820325 [Lissotriton helveticus]
MAHESGHSKHALTGAKSKRPKNDPPSPNSSPNSVLDSILEEVCGLQPFMSATNMKLNQIEGKLAIMEGTNRPPLPYASRRAAQIDSAPDYFAVLYDASHDSGQTKIQSVFGRSIPTSCLKLLQPRTPILPLNYPRAILHRHIMLSAPPPS